MDIGAIFFLPAAYWLILAISGIVTGLVFRVDKNVILTTLLLFAMFSIPQLVYRVNNGEAPERLIGQYVYLVAFMGVAGATSIIIRGRI